MEEREIWNDRMAQSQSVFCFVISFSTDSMLHFLELGFFAPCRHVWLPKAILQPYKVNGGLLLMFVGCLLSQQHVSVYQERICSDNFTCSHTEIEVADPTFHLTQSPYTDTGPTIPSTDPIMPGAWQVSHWSANV